MDDRRLDDICKHVENEWGWSGLSDTCYAEYAKQVAKLYYIEKMEEKLNQIKSKREGETIGT